MLGAHTPRVHYQALEFCRSRQNALLVLLLFLLVLKYLLRFYVAFGVSSGVVGARVGALGGLGAIQVNQNVVDILHYLAYLVLQRTVPSVLEGRRGLWEAFGLLLCPRKAPLNIVSLIHFVSRLLALGDDLSAITILIKNIFAHLSAASSQALRLVVRVVVARVADEVATWLLLLQVLGLLATCPLFRGLRLFALMLKIHVVEGVVVAVGWGLEGVCSGLRLVGAPYHI